MGCALEKRGTGDILQIPRWRIIVLVGRAAMYTRVPARISRFQTGISDKKKRKKEKGGKNPRRRKLPSTD